MSSGSGTTSGPADRCALCGRPGLYQSRTWLLRRGDGTGVCRECVAGYRLCEHGYMILPCWECRKARADRAKKGDDDGHGDGSGGPGAPVPSGG